MVSRCDSEDILARLIASTNYEIVRTRLPVLTGAGASFSLGYPLMANAIQKYQEFLWNLPVQETAGPSRRGRLKHYYRHLQEELRNREEPFDLESMLGALNVHISYLERANLSGLTSWMLGEVFAKSPIGGDPVKPLESLKDLRLSLMEFIHQVYRTPLANPARASVSRAFLALQQALTPRRFALLTTNYDSVPDVVPSVLKSDPIDGFRSHSPDLAATWDPEEFDRFLPDSSQLPIFHLHGSASWFRIDGEIRRYRGVARLIPGFESMLVYPGEGKDGLGALPEPSRLGYKYLAQMASTHRLLISIGYSFRDLGIRKQLERAAAFAQQRIRVVVIAPATSDSVVELFREPHIDGSFISGKFEDPDTWSPILRMEIGGY